jgi:hypothetical protein
MTAARRLVAASRQFTEDDMIKFSAFGLVALCATSTVPAFATPSGSATHSAPDVVFVQIHVLGAGSAIDFQKRVTANRRNAIADLSSRVIATIAKFDPATATVAL